MSNFIEVIKTAFLISKSMVKTEVDLFRQRAYTSVYNAV